MSQKYRVECIDPREQKIADSRLSAFFQARHRHYVEQHRWESAGRYEGMEIDNFDSRPMPGSTQLPPQQWEFTGGRCLYYFWNRENREIGGDDFEPVLACRAVLAGGSFDHHALPMAEEMPGNCATARINGLPIAELSRFVPFEAIRERAALNFIRQASDFGKACIQHLNTHYNVGRVTLITDERLSQVLRRRGGFRSCKCLNGTPMIVEKKGKRHALHTVCEGQSCQPIE